MKRILLALIFGRLVLAGLPLNAGETGGVPNQPRSSRALSIADALNSFQTERGLRVELVVAEPLTASP